MSTKNGAPAPLRSGIHAGRLILGAILVVALLVLPACRAADPVAPNDAILSINANPPSIALGEVSRITVIATRSDGVPVVDGTVINLTTTLGSIAEEIFTQKGIASTDLHGGTISGDATVTASAGAASSVNTTVHIGSTTSTLTISANPGSLPYGGGSSTITCIAFDENSQPLSGIPVQFSTDEGSLDSGGALKYTNGNGVVQDVLRTSLTATVTATSGSITPATVTVTVADDTSTPPPSPSSISVTANPPVVSPGQPSSIIATVFDSTGQPLSGAGVVFSTTQGTLNSGGSLIYTNSRGQAKDVLVTYQNASVTATSGSVSGNVAVTVTTGSAASITLTANPAQISACTDAPLLIATVLDANGVGVQGALVSFSLASGSVGALSVNSATTDANGQAFANLTISQTECTNCQTVGSNCTSTVTATSGGLSASFTINVNP